MKLENFSYRKSRQQKSSFESKKKVFIEITKNSPKFFFLAGDNLSIEPILSGIYEPHIKSLIDYSASCGNRDFLIDIGANIGLTSCQSGPLFKEVHMFEPNPTCISILKLNTRIALGGCNYQIHEYGLGESSRSATLKVPLGNMGGAFIDDAANSYSNEILAMKDNFNVIEERNYQQEDVRIESAAICLSNLFKTLISKNLKSGVVKIDVEGYEPVILEALTLVPEQMSLTIIFESWDKDYDFNGLLSLFGKRATGYKLKSKRFYDNLFHRLLKKFTSRYLSNEEYTLNPFLGKDASGDLVISVKNLS